jgi:GGDEF domain-containing protein
MADPTAHRRVPRAVADAPVGRLADGSVVAKAWLVALVDAAPLRDAAAVPVAQLAAEGSALCAAVLEALGSEAALDRLRPGGDRAGISTGVARLAGAHGPAAAVAAVEALRSAIWETLGADDAQLAVRLAHVCATVLEAALAGTPAVTAPSIEVPEAAAPTIDAPVVEAPVVEEPVIDAPVVEAPVAEEPVVPAPTEPAVIVHDARGTTDVDEPWRAPIERRLERQSQDGRPFSVLTLEIDDIDRLLAAATGQEVVGAIEAAERAITGQLRPADMLVRERLGRYWLTAPETDLAAGRALGQRLADAVAAAAFHHGAPLAVSIGLAVSPDDALDADTLAAHADEGLFAARAAGVRLA